MIILTDSTARRFSCSLTIYRLSTTPEGYFDSSIIIMIPLTSLQYINWLQLPMIILTKSSGIFIINLTKILYIDWTLLPMIILTDKLQEDCHATSHYIWTIHYSQSLYWLTNSSMTLIIPLTSALYIDRPIFPMIVLTCDLSNDFRATSHLLSSAFSCYSNCSLHIYRPLNYRVNTLNTLIFLSIYIDWPNFR